MGKQWYEIHYKNSAHVYEEESFVQGTINEVDFVENELKHKKDVTILDVGCGTGRHSIELAKRGYQNVVGIDLSESLINRAKQIAFDEKIDITFERKNACELDYDNQFDFAMIMCEGAFSLVESDEKDNRILQGVYNALRPNGKFIMTAPSALFQIKNSDGENFDLLTFRETFKLNSKDDFGNIRKLVCTQRYYTPTELRFIMTNIGFKNIEFFGCNPGDFSRDNQLNCDMFELMVVARK